jgi:hypothetical protein
MVVYQVSHFVVSSVIVIFAPMLLPAVQLESRGGGEFCKRRSLNGSIDSNGVGGGGGCGNRGNIAGGKEGSLVSRETSLNGNANVKAETPIEHGHYNWSSVRKKMHQMHVKHGKKGVKINRTPSIIIASKETTVSRKHLAACLMGINALFSQVQVCIFFFSHYNAFFFR